MDELTQEFLAESTEGLDRMERCLTELEQRPDDAELLGEIFRAVHTIKGTTGFLGLARLERLAHAGESLLGELREHRVRVNAELISGLLRLMDGLRAILLVIERTGHEGTREQDDDTRLIAALDALRTRQDMASASGAAACEPSACCTTATEPAPWTRPLPPAAPALTGTLHHAADKTVRVDVEVLNRMMNLVGELVLTRNQILQSHVEASAFPQLSRRLDAVTADLRETVMQARMQPVGTLFGKFPRMVRDLARGCGKQVRLECSGESTGLDRGLLEAIKDPLTHAVRNAVDHGIETPQQRFAAGKPAEGVVHLTARHQGGSVIIELRDDGRGIACGKVLAKAIERGLVAAERAAEMTGREVLDLIFLPGFSTASAVTTVSGRGVGMDVVRANVEAVGGSVEVESDEGRGTLVRLRLPLTLAIVPALVVCSGGQSFCLPQGSLAELLYVSRHEAGAVVERIGDAELYCLRDELLPMIRLDRLLGMETADGAAGQAHGFYLAVLEAECCRFGLVVDDLLAPEEIVVKPLSPVLREIGLFSGATVLGNGTLAMILDVAATAVRAQVRPLTDQVASRARSLPVAIPEFSQTGEQPSFLIYEDTPEPSEPHGPRERRALPLWAVERIETIRASQVEAAGRSLLLQYRGALLPLEDTGGVLTRAAARAADAELTVLICQRGGADKPPATAARRFGLIVERVVDISAGTVPDPGQTPAGDRLALIHDRLAVLHAGFGGTPLEDAAWKEVA